MRTGKTMLVSVEERPSISTLKDMVDEVPCAKKHRNSGGNICQHCKVVESYLLVGIIEEAEDSVFFFTHSHLCQMMC